MMQNDFASETPLIEQMRDVPKDATFKWREPDGLRAWCSAPVGYYCREAADRIEALTDETKALRERVEELEAFVSDFSSQARLPQGIMYRSKRITVPADFAHRAATLKACLKMAPSGRAQDAA